MAKGLQIKRAEELKALRRLMRKNELLLAKSVMTLEELYSANESLKSAVNRLAVTALSAPPEMGADGRRFNQRPEPEG